MSKTPWTKGPWTLWDGDIVAQSDACNPIVTLYDDTSDADARLIAAAPNMAEALAALLRRDEINTCQHAETHRGGFLWEICDQCGAKWADDEGGKPEWVDPPEWKAARDALAKARGEQ